MNNIYNIKNIITILCFLFSVFYYVLPQGQLVVSVFQAGIVLGIIFIVLSFLWGKNLMPLRDIKFLCPFILIFFLVSKPLDLKFGFLHPLLLAWITIFPIALYNCICRIGSLKLRMLLLVLAIGVLMYVVYNTIIQMTENPNIARAMTSGNTDEDYVMAMKMTGVGGFGISYSSGLMAIAMLSTWKLMRKWNVVKIICLLLFLFFSYMVVKAQFTTLLLITTLCCVISVYFSNVSTRKSYLKFIIFVLLGTLLISILFPLALEFYQGTPIGEHLQQLSNGSVSDSDRSQYQLKCFYLMLESPLWGRDITTGYSYLFTHSHSTILGYGLATGLVGVGFYMYALMKMFIGEFSNFQKKNSRQYYIVYMIFYILLSILNPSESQEVSFTFFFIIPLLTNIFLYNETRR